MRVTFENLDKPQMADLLKLTADGGYDRIITTAEELQSHSLTNAQISANYRGVEVYMMRKGFTGPFASWVVQQSPYEVPDIRVALAEFNDYVTRVMAGETVKMFTYDELNEIISESEFEKIPAVMALNVAKVNSGPDWESRYRNDDRRKNPDYDFISLGALARNVFYSIIRNHINWL